MNAVVVALAVLGAADASASRRQVQVQVAVRSGDPLGSEAQGTLRSLAEPNLTAMNGQRASFLAGAYLPIATADGPKLTGSGIQFEFTPTLRAGATATLHHRFTLHQRDPATGRIRSASCEATQVVKLGEKIRFRITADAPDSQTWAEVTVTEVKP